MPIPSAVAFPTSPSLSVKDPATLRRCRFLVRYAGFSDVILIAHAKTCNSQMSSYREPEVALLQLRITCMSYGDCQLTYCNLGIHFSLTSSPALKGSRSITNSGNSRRSDIIVS